jgi:acyl-CoA reductase-like NAD-dependent aldehyde dehydrogenase
MQRVQPLFSMSPNSVYKRTFTQHVRGMGFFSFIGSAAVGWMLRSRLAPGARCSLEHGGAAPVLVAPDADLGAAFPKLVFRRKEFITAYK